MFFISPPFGNYIQLPHTTSIAGSFTIDPRPGLFQQILKTLRYSFSYGGWINQIGLRNKGIDWALTHVPPQRIISIAIMRPEEIEIFRQKLPKNRNIEINISCPNVQKSYQQLEQVKTLIHPSRKWCILKLSPLCTNDQVDMYYNQGFRHFHCSNTFPTPYGGLSGAFLQKYNAPLIEYIRQKYKDAEIIGAGGIQSWSDVQYFSHLGCQHFSISTGFFRPIKMLKLYYKYWRSTNV